MEETPELAQPEAAADPQETSVVDSKKQILKSTGILGFTQVIIILIGIARTKVLAILLGAAGVGVAGLYQNTIELVRAATGLGLRSSAVRDIAASAAIGEQERLSATIKVLRSWAWFTGIMGTVLAIIFCKVLSRWAFGNEEYAWGILTLSINILIISIAEGQSALLQGLRLISAMAKARVGSAIAGLIGSVIIFWIWGMSGIVPALVFINLTVLVWNWYYSRNITTVSVTMNLKEIFRKGKSMASLGLYMSITGIASTGTMYLVRAFIVRQGGLPSVGHFVAAWSISYIYLSSVFGAMATDYFPRLSAVQKDQKQMTRLVNEQSEVAILIVSPVIIAMLTFIELVVKVFYSKEFGPTAYILDWQLMGDFFKALAWSMGFILLAKGKGRAYLFTELSWNLLYVGGVYFLWPYMGITSTGISFLIAFAVYTLILFVMARKFINFRFSRHIREYAFVFLPLMLLTFLAQKFLNRPYDSLLGCCALAIATFYSYSKLKTIFPVQKILSRFGIRKSK